MENQSHQTYKYILAISIISLAIRLFRIGVPAEVVFDEVHFGGFASNYLKREYYFDIHPPVGKMIIAGIGYLLGYDGSFHFKDIGDSFLSSTIPYRSIRASIALLSSVTIGINMLTLKDMGLSTAAVILTGLLLSFDVASTIQSRLILLDTPLIFFISLSLWGWVRFLKERRRPLSLRWFAWLTITGIGLGGSIGTKMVGLLTVGTIGLMTILDLWQISAVKKGRKRISTSSLLFKHLSSRFILLFCFPISIYLAGYYVHFAILTKTGPGDPHMSANFQSSLRGNNYSAGTRQIYYGNSVMFKNRLEPLYLHSHLSRYEVTYEDGRVSSGGQQVTLYSVEDDANNWWRVLPVDDDDGSGNGNGGSSNNNNKSSGALGANSQSNNNPSLQRDSQWLKPSRRPVMNGDRVRLLHLKTETYLRTHDVASTLTKTNMEISTTVDRENDDTIWVLETKAPNSSSKPPRKVRSLSCQLRIRSPKYAVTLCNHQQVLPDWAHEQIEVNGDKKSTSDATRWTVDSVLEPKDVSDEIQEKIDTFNLKKLGFWAKFLELQELQLTKNDLLTSEHPFQSHPSSWPFLLRGISYWDKKDDGKRIYFQGNPAVWIMGITAVVSLFFAGLSMIWRIHRMEEEEVVEENNGYIGNGIGNGIDDNNNITATKNNEINNNRQNSIIYKSGFLLLAWAMHYLPFFTMRRVLYLHHYLPSLTMSLMIVGCMWDYCSMRLSDRIYGVGVGGCKVVNGGGLIGKLMLCIISCWVIWCFWRLAPITYGTHIPTTALNSRKWFSSWDWP